MTSFWPLLLLILFTDGLESKEAARFRYAGEQGYDLSCGVAVASDALALGRGIEASEEALAVAVGTIADDMISAADLMRAMESFGVTVRAFQLTWEGLAAALAKGYGPLIVHYAIPNGHFALLAGMDSDFAVLADPARGLEALGRGEFMKRYSGVALVMDRGTFERERLAALMDSARIKIAALESVAARTAWSVGRQ